MRIEHRTWKLGEEAAVLVVPFVAVSWVPVPPMPPMTLADAGSPVQVVAVDAAAQAACVARQFAQPVCARADPDREIAALCKTVARTVAVKIAQRCKDFSAKFPMITVSKGA